MKWNLLKLLQTHKEEKVATVKNYSEKDTAFAIDAYTKSPTRDTVEQNC